MNIINILLIAGLALLSVACLPPRITHKLIWPIIKFGDGGVLSRVVYFANAAPEKVVTLFLTNQIPRIEAGKDHWVQLSPFGDFANRQGASKVIQRFRPDDARQICNTFNSPLNLIKQPLGMPFYIGHPDHPRFAGQPGHNDTRAYGRGREMAVREDANCPVCKAFANGADSAPCHDHGLFVKMHWNPDGEHLIANESYHGHSVNWAAVPDGSEGGVQIYRPIRVKSAGFTNEPNIPVKPASLANAASDDADAPDPAVVVPPRLKLLAGFKADDDVTMEQVLDALEKARGGMAANEAATDALGWFAWLKGKLAVGYDNLPDGLRYAVNTLLEWQENDAKLKALMGEAMANVKPEEDDEERKSPPEGYPADKAQYADPDNYKYPVDTKEHTAAAWKFINKKDNAAKYGKKDLEAVRGRIKTAAKKHGIEIAEDQANEAASEALGFFTWLKTEMAKGFDALPDCLRYAVNTLLEYQENQGKLKAIMGEALANVTPLQPRADGVAAALGQLLLTNADAAMPDDADKKSFVDQVHEMLGSDPAGGKAGALNAIKEKVKKAGLVENVKKAGAAAKAAMDRHIQARQDLEAHLANERKARATLVIDGLVKTGKVVTKDRDARILELCNIDEDKFDARAAEFANGNPTVKTTSKTTGLSREQARVAQDERARGAQMQELLDQRAREFPNESYMERFEAVAASAAGAQLFAQMKRPGATAD